MTTCPGAWPSRVAAFLPVEEYRYCCAEEARIGQQQQLATGVDGYYPCIVCRLPLTKRLQLRPFCGAAQDSHYILQHSTCIVLRCWRSRPIFVSRSTQRSVQVFAAQHRTFPIEQVEQLPFYSWAVRCLQIARHQWQLASGGPSTQTARPTIVSTAADCCSRLRPPTAAAVPGKPRNRKRRLLAAHLI